MNPSSDHIWVYGTQANNRTFHLLTSLEDRPEGANWQVNGRATRACSSERRTQFETSLEPPEHLELCDKCALIGFESWVVYRAYDADGELLYVGVTNDLESRMRSHKNCKTWSHRWYPRLARIEADVVENRYAAGAAEREAIRTLNPTFNTTYKSELVPA